MAVARLIRRMGLQAIERARRVSDAEHRANRGGCSVASILHNALLDDGSFMKKSFELKYCSTKLLHKALGAALLSAVALCGSSASAAPMHVSGHQLFDACGQPFVVRGVEQILGRELPPGNDWLGLLEQISATGANAVRILPGVNTLTVDDVDQALTLIGEKGMIAFIDPLNSSDNWLARSDVKAMLKKHESYLIIDAYGEPQYDDRDKWRSEAAQALQDVRDLGYQVPLTVTANQFGRDLPSLFAYGDEILAADPEDNTFLGWQAYWGQSGYYQDTYGMSLSEAVLAIVDSGLPIQMGLDHITDLPSQSADFQTLMQAAEVNDIGWLWWDWYNPYGSENNLSNDGTVDDLTPTGKTVVRDHLASISRTAHLTCSGASAASEPIAINAGGAEDGAFVADTGFAGGNLAPVSSVAIDRSRVPAPVPPEAVYQTERWGAMSYHVPGFAPGSSHRVTLHFAEIYFSAAGQRKFHVNINGSRKLTDFDIFASAGANNRALAKTFDVTAKSNGEIVIDFEVGSVDQPKISGIVID
jgi:malectin (di-glucose binding ER protein)/cellulase (glycosyl hydrolase family 5)